MKKEKMLKEVEKLYFKEEALLRVLNSKDKEKNELKEKISELKGNNAKLTKENRQLKQQIKGLQAAASTNAGNIDIKEIVKTGLEYLTKTMEYSQADIIKNIN